MNPWRKHPTIPVEHPSGESIEIDSEIAPLLEALWGHGIETTGSCQDDGGMVWLGFATPDEAALFIRTLAVEPSPDIESLYERQAGIGDEDAWQWQVWFEPQMTSEPDFAFLIELRFPRKDLAEVVERVNR